MTVGEQALGRFETLCGLALVDVTPERVVAEVSVREDLTDEAGEVHGGVYAALAQAAAVAGTRLGAAADGSAVRAMANLLSLIAPVTGGSLRATAVRRHAGRTTWVWEVELADAAGRLCAMSRLTVAIHGPAS